jgi:hypothetical protein
MNIQLFSKMAVFWDIARCSLIYAVKAVPNFCQYLSDYLMQHLSRQSSSYTSTFEFRTSHDYFLLHVTSCNGCFIQQPYLQSNGIRSSVTFTLH